jgi:hypothetical protein
LRFTDFEDDGSFSNLSIIPGEDNAYALSLDDGIVLDGDEYYLMVEFDLPDFDPATMPAGAQYEEAEGAYVMALRQSPSTSAAPVPEPGTLMLLGSGLVGLVGFRKKFK